MLQGNQFHLKFHEFSAIAENPQGHTTLSLRHCMFTLMHSLFFFFFSIVTPQIITHTAAHLWVFNCLTLTDDPGLPQTFSLLR